MSPSDYFEFIQYTPMKRDRYEFSQDDDCCLSAKFQKHLCFHTNNEESRHGLHTSNIRHHGVIQNLARHGRAFRKPEKNKMEKLRYESEMDI